MKRKEVREGDLVWVLPDHLGSDQSSPMIAMKRRSASVDILQFSDRKLGIFLRREAFDLPNDSEVMPVVLVDGHEHTVLIGRLVRC
jgi:hypothetical protein